MKQGSILVGGVIFKTGVLEERSKKTVAFLSKAKAGKNQGDSKKMAPPPKEVEEDSEDEEMSEDEDDESSGEEVIVYSSMLNCLELQNGDLKQVVLDV